MTVHRGWKNQPWPFSYCLNEISINSFRLIVSRSLILSSCNLHIIMVIMSMEAYDELLSIAVTDAAIEDAERELEQGGKLENARIALASLRRKHFGTV